MQLRRSPSGPLTGGGRAYWFQTSPLLLVPASPNWQALVAGSENYSAGPAATFQDFELNTTTGVVTYTGPGGVFRVTATLSIVCLVATDWHLAISLNGELLGTPTAAHEQGEQITQWQIANVAPQVIATRVLALGLDDTVQAVFRVPAINSGVDRATFDIVQLGD